MAQNDDMSNPLDFGFWGLGQLTPNVAVEKIVNAKQQLYMDYININERAKRGESINGSDFNTAENNYNGQISKALKYLPPDYSARSAIQDSNEAFTDWQKQNKLPSIDSIEPLNKIFARDYVVLAPAKNTTISKDTDTQQKLFGQLLSKGKGIAFAGTKDDSAEIDLVTNNMQFFRDNSVGTVYLIGHSEELNKFKNLYTEELREKLDDMSEKLKKTPTLRPTYAADNQEKLILSLLLSGRENGISILDIGNKEEAGKFESSLSGNHRVASSNFVHTDAIKTEQIMSLFPAIDKYIVIGNQENFIATSDKANGKLDEALGIAVIALKSADNHQPLIERGTSDNGPDFYLRTHACRPDPKGLALAGDYNDMSKAISNNVDRVQNEGDARAANHYASILNKKAAQLRSDYAQFLEACEVPELEAKTPGTTPPVQLASSAIIKK